MVSSFSGAATKLFLLWSNDPHLAGGKYGRETYIKDFATYVSR